MDVERTSALVSALRQAAHDLVGRRGIADLEQTLQQIVESAVETVPGADAGGITMTTGRGEVGSRNPSTDDVRYLDGLQTTLHEGPCISAVESAAEVEGEPDDGVVLASDLAEPPDATRWPTFAPQAVEYGYRSMMSTRLSPTSNGVRAALNLYSHAPHTFDTSARALASLFGVQAALLLYGADQATHLTAALGSRDTIGQAKGILMERFDVDADQAFQMVVQSSQRTNLKLADVAQWLTTHRTDTSAPGPRTS
ncbi:GAF and ANTAR domain-containing protein [Pseudonocardia parietis]|uniref:ANTAR domain-containing protein n=1 Tax=Pseudonocardia parietis TaxID=570936 RepID=A0ABS4W499_9PSEU|nr:GAF and ANTAR domain-containing protein [Pseudonocardia parietis]MBP2371047.1 hypothetical protein [Pseudonocardia parietis]